MIEKIKSLSSSSANGQRIAEISKRAKMQKRQKKKKKKRERERERRKRNGDASSWSTSISPWLRSFNNGCKGKKKKKLFEGVSNFA